MGRKRIGTGGKVEFDWDESRVREWARDPGGPLGETLLKTLADTVLAGAKRRALRRTGRMAGQMYSALFFGQGEAGVIAIVASPVTDPRSHNFPYPIVHEGRKVRDRRPHRSLRPALRDIRHSHYVSDFRDTDRE